MTPRFICQTCQCLFFLFGSCFMGLELHAFVALHLWVWWWVRNWYRTDDIVRILNQNSDYAESLHQTPDKLELRYRSKARSQETPENLTRPIRLVNGNVRVLVTLDLVHKDASSSSTTVILAYCLLIDGIDNGLRVIGEGSWKLMPYLDTLHPNEESKKNHSVVRINNF